MSESVLEETNTVDVLRYETPEGETYRPIEAGRGQAVVDAHRREVRKRKVVRWLLLAFVAAFAVGYGAFVSRPLLGALTGAIVLVVAYLQDDRWTEEMVPELVERGIRARDAEARYELEDP